MMDDMTILSIAERRIQEAMDRGDFDDLPGSGRPLPQATAPYKEHWWIRSWLDRNSEDERPLSRPRP